MLIFSSLLLIVFGIATASASFSISLSLPTSATRPQHSGRKSSSLAEIKKDLGDVLDPVIHLTSDHGTGGYKMRSHKNILTISRCTKDFVIKTDIVAVMVCKGNQTGDVIRY